METITVQEHTDVCPRTCTYFGCDRCYRHHTVTVERPVITLSECAQRLGVTVDWEGNLFRSTVKVIFNDRRNVNHVCGGEVLYTFSGTYLEHGRMFPSCATFGLVKREDGRVIAVAFG